MSSQEQPDIGVDLFDSATYLNGAPHAAFARLRAECPVYWQEERARSGWPAGPGYWAVTRWADVVHVGRTPSLFSSNLGATQIRDPDAATLAFVRKMMLNLDPPAHSGLRKLVSRGFTPRNVERLRGVIEQRARAIVDRVAPLGACDFPVDIGAELPLLTLAELMGVPAEDRGLLRGWADRVIGHEDSEYSEQLKDSGRPRDARSRDALADMFAYAHELAEAKRRDPGDDIISQLLSAEVDGHRLSDEEFENFFFLLAVAGNETLRNGIPGGMLALIEHPDQLARLLADPGLLPTAVDEMLRWHAPVLCFRRTATRDTELAGTAIREGDKVVVYYVSANRDEAVFADADTFDVGRRPNEHLSFGAGPHFCVGASLARLQMQCLFRELLWRLPDIELAGPVQRLQSSFQQGIKHMPVTYGAPTR
jgi:cytochrome P450